ncbi:hypothetical protein ABZV46_31870, partial [Streptomyces sp. NPDC005209]
RRRRPRVRCSSRRPGSRRPGDVRQTTGRHTHLSERLLEAHQMPETRHQPYLLLCASLLDEDTAWQLADVIDRAGTVPVTLIALVSTAAACFPEAEILNASRSEPQHLDSAGTDITVQRLEHAAYQQITTALKVSAQPSHPAEGPWQDVPDEPAGMQQSPAPRAVGPDGRTGAGVTQLTLAKAENAAAQVTFSHLAGKFQPPNR